QDDKGFDEIERHRHGGAMTFKELVGNDPSTEGTNYGHQRHQVYGPKDGGRLIFEVQLQLVVKVKDHELIRTVSDGAGAGVSQRIKPNQRMGEDRGERFL